MNTNLEWRKSSYSGDKDACVELAVTAKRTHVRDSKSPEDGALEFKPPMFKLFLSTLKG